MRFYAEHGWYLSKKLFTDDEVDELVAASERYYAGERDRALPVRPPKLAYWEPAKGDVQRHNDYVHYEHDGIGRDPAQAADRRGRRPAGRRPTRSGSSSPR